MIKNNHRGAISPSMISSVVLKIITPQHGFNIDEIFFLSALESYVYQIDKKVAL